MPEVEPWYTSRTIITALVMMALTILELSGVIPPEQAAIDKIIDGLLALGAIYIFYLRLEPSPAKPLSRAQQEAIRRSCDKA